MACGILQACFSDADLYLHCLALPSNRVVLIAQKLISIRCSLPVWYLFSLIHMIPLMFRPLSRLYHEHWMPCCRFVSTSFPWRWPSKATTQLAILFNQACVIFFWSRASCMPSVYGSLNGVDVHHQACEDLIILSLFSSIFLIILLLSDLHHEKNKDTCTLLVEHVLAQPNLFHRVQCRWPIKILHDQWSPQTETPVVAISNSIISNCFKLSGLHNDISITVSKLLCCSSGSLIWISILRFFHVITHTLL